MDYDLGGGDSTSSRFTIAEAEEEVKQKMLYELKDSDDTASANITKPLLLFICIGVLILVMFITLSKKSPVKTKKE